MKKITTFALLLLTTFTFAQTITDFDYDGMDDDWEEDNGLNTSTRTDAWLDADEDGILNLFEFQLGSDPQDPLSPSIIELASSDDLDQLINQAAVDITVIRIPEGDYDVNIDKNVNTNLKLMLQGGWNSDFTDYNPDFYKTTLNGKKLSEVLQFEVKNNKVNYSIILDGLYVVNGGGEGNLIVSDTKGNYCYLSIYNCKFYGSSKVGVGVVQSSTDSWPLTFVIKSIFANNTKEGLAYKTLDNTRSRLRVYNSIFTQNETYGISLEMLDAESKLFSEITNSVVYHNTNTGFYLKGDVTFDILYSNYDKIENIEGEADVTENASNIIEFGPSFVSASNLDFRLKPNSPCIDGGTFIGFGFVGTRPDIGVYEFDPNIGINDLDSKFEFATFPNPIAMNEPLNVYLNGIPNSKNLTLQLFDLNGKNILSKKIINSNDLNNSFTLEGINSQGVYFLKLKEGEKILKSNKILIY